MNLKLIKKQWLKFIPSGTCFVKKENIGLFSNSKHINREVLNWNKLWFFLNYQLIALKNTIFNKNRILFVTDIYNYSFFVKNIALKTNNFFVIGPWEGGYLTSIKWYKYLPTFIINFGIIYSKKFLNETKIMGIPHINFLTNIGLKKKFSTNFNIPFFNKEPIIMRNLCCFFAYLIKKNNNFFNYSFEIMLDDLNTFYRDKIKAIFNKIFYFKKITLNFKIFNFLIFKHFLFIKNINNIDKLNFIFSTNFKKLFAFNKNYIPIFYKYFQKKHKKYFLQKNIAVFMVKKKTKFLKLKFLNTNLYNKKINDWITVTIINND